MNNERRLAAFKASLQEVDWPEIVGIEFDDQLILILTALGASQTKPFLRLRIEWALSELVKLFESPLSTPQDKTAFVKEWVSLVVDCRSQLE